MLNVSQLSCERDHRLLFENLEFAVAPGEVLWVEGSNGAGKTTLLRVLSGLYTDYTGQVSWDLPQLPLYLGHKPGVKDLLSARENLGWLANMQQGPATAAAITAALTKVGLRGFEDVLCGAMSEGQRKRVNLARLYLLDSIAWVLDEPFSAIDVAGIQSLEQRMGEHLDAGGLIIIISHQRLALPHAIRSLRLGS